MVIYLPGEQREPQAAPEPSFDELTPREIVVELDKYVVGQDAAKRAVAIALRNRMRRQKLTPELAEEVLPKNIIMIGPTGVGQDGDRAPPGRWRTPRSSRWKPPSSPKSATWDAMSSP